MEVSVLGSVGVDGVTEDGYVVGFVFGEDVVFDVFGVDGVVGHDVACGGRVGSPDEMRMR